MSQRLVSDHCRMLMEVGDKGPGPQVIAQDNKAIAEADGRLAEIEESMDANMNTGPPAETAEGHA